MNRLMFELRFLLVGKLSKGFAMSCTEEKKVSANICKSIGSDWVRVRLSEEGYHTSFDGPALHSLSQLLLTACTHMNIMNIHA